MAEGFRIDSYEPFIIGMKLKPDIDINSIKKRMKLVLENNEFEIPPTTQLNDIKPLAEIIGLKDGVEFKINLQTRSFNIEGDDIEEVLSITRNIPKFLEEANFNISDTIDFYEMHAKIIAETGNNPREFINNSFRVNLDSLSDDLEMNVSGIKIGSISESSKKLINFIIEPRAGNPTKFYYLGAMYRSDDLNNLITSANDLPKTIEQLLDSLEGR